jgi:hypothetical protein
VETHTAAQVYPGLKLPPGNGGRRIDPMQIPGVVEAGWRPQPLGFNLLRPDGVVVEPNATTLGNFMREVRLAAQWLICAFVEWTRKLRERVVNYDTLSPSCKPHSTNTGLGPLTVLN